MKTEKIRTILELIRWNQDYFLRKGIESPRLNIELMLSKILKCSRIDLYLHYDLPLSESQLSTLRNYVLRRANHEPLQYILEEAPFCGNTFKSDNRALIPRPETELLVNEAVCYLKIIDKKYPKILEIGTGSGCISISIAVNFPEAEIFATDISIQALSLAEENSQLHNVSNIKFMEHNFLTDNFFDEDYDLIISNPPYIPEEHMILLDKSILNFEPINALNPGKDELIFYKRFLESMNLIKNEGIMLLEIDGRNTDKLKEMINFEKFEVKIIKDFSGYDRILSIQHKNL